MGKNKQIHDVEAGGTYYYVVAPPPPPPPQPLYNPAAKDQWTPWLVPLIFVVDIAMFVYTMYVNNCPETYPYPERCLFKKHLGRFAFLPLNQNPLLGPSSTTVQKLGGLQLEKVQQGEAWRLITCMWLHAGAIHLLANMFSLLFIGVRLEEEFGFLRIAPLYLLSGLGGSIMSCLNILRHRDNHNSFVSVGASGALFGLLGAMLSELITNWTIYANKCAAITTLIGVIAFNLAFGLIPHVDNSAHIGGILSGFLLGFVILMRPQYGYVSKKYLPPGYKKKKSKYMCYQYLLFIVACVLLILGYAGGLLKLLRPGTYQMVNGRMIGAPA